MSKQDFRFDVSFAKSDPVRRELHVDLYKGGALDSVGDYMTPDTVRAMVHDLDPKAVGIDREHDGKPLHASHARVVEKSYDETTAAARAVIKFSEAGWRQIVEPGVFKGVSIFGQGKRRPGVVKSADGKEQKGTEIFEPVVSLISLTAKPANRTQDPAFIAKSDEAPAWARELLASNATLAAEIAELKAGDVKKSSGSPSTAAELRKAERDARAVELRKSHAVLSDQLERLWSAEGASLFDPGHRRAKEAELCVEIDRVERELATLNKSGIDFDGRHSAFKFRGGVSERLSADKIFPAGDSAFERPAEALSKREDGLPIDTLLL